MPRISLKEAYDNRDVIAWLVKHQDAIDEMMNILQNINPDGDLTNIVLKTGDQTIDGVKTFIGKIVANCDIIQNGAAYETHAEQLFTHNDYIVTRDGALGGLQPGEFSGFRVNRYDSVHDGHLVIDASGTARVGDVGDEQPLSTRDEAANMTDGALVTWDSANVKIKAAASNIGTDAQPVKIVGGVPVPVSVSLMYNLETPVTITPSGSIGVYQSVAKKVGRTVEVFMYFSVPSALTNVTLFSLSSTEKVRATISPLADVVVGSAGTCNLWSSNGADEYTHNFIIPADGTLQAGIYALHFNYQTVI